MSFQSRYLGQRHFDISHVFPDKGILRFIQKRFTDDRYSCRTTIFRLHGYKNSGRYVFALARTAYCISVHQLNSLTTARSCRCRCIPIPTLSAFRIPPPVFHETGTRTLYMLCFPKCHFGKTGASLFISVRIDSSVDYHAFPRACTILVKQGRRIRYCM